MCIWRSVCGLMCLNLFRVQNLFNQVYKLSGCSGNIQGKICPNCERYSRSIVVTLFGISTVLLAFLVLSGAVLTLERVRSSTSSWGNLLIIARSILSVVQSFLKSLYCSPSSSSRRSPQPINNKICVRRLSGAVCNQVERNIQ